MRMRLLTSLLLMLWTAATGAQTVSTIAGPIDAAGGMSVGPNGSMYIGNFEEAWPVAGPDPSAERQLRMYACCVKLCTFVVAEFRER